MRGGRRGALMLGAAGDAFGDIIYGYWLASGFAVLLFCGSILNWALNSTRAVLEQRDMTEYEAQNPDTEWRVPRAKPRHRFGCRSLLTTPV